jgi:Xaa-Pro aminopeptidase
VTVPFNMETDWYHAPARRNLATLEASAVTRDEPHPSSDRLSAVQHELRLRGLAALLVVGSGDHGTRGHIRYLTGHSLWDRAGYCVVAPAGEPTLVLLTVSQRFWARRLGHVEDVRFAPAPIEEVASLLRPLLESSDGNMVGIAGFADAMSASDHCALTAALPEAQFIDATDILQRLEAIKDPDEQTSLQRAARVADAGFRLVDDVLRPGSGEWEVNGAVQRELFAGGAFDTLPLTMHRRGEPYLCVPQEREYWAGELASYSIEIPSPDGYWVELARMFSLGEPDPTALDGVELLHSVHLELSDLLRPGARVGDLADAAARMVNGTGYRLGHWLGHGIGLNLPDWPPILAGEETIVTEGMVFAIHPHVIGPRDELGLYVSDTFIVEASSARPLSTLPLELHVVGE